jgi:co-chaperonin GroES (HSP10)
MSPYGPVVLVSLQAWSRNLPRGKVLAVGDGHYDPGGTLRVPRVSIGEILFLRPDYQARAIITTDGAGTLAHLVLENDILGVDE